MTSPRSSTYSGWFRNLEDERLDLYDNGSKLGLAGPTVLVAANDSSKGNKIRADYVCDGTDDDVEIQAAIDFLRGLDVEGGTVLLSEGNFTIGSAINVDGNMVIRGMGIAATILTLADGANTDIFKYDRSTNDFEFNLEYLTLHGNKTNNTSGNGFHSERGSGTLQDIHLVYVFPQSFAEQGFHIENSWGLTIEGCIIEFCEKDGCELLGGNGKLSHCKFGRNNEAGTGNANLWCRGNQIMIYGCQFWSSNANGQVAEGVRVSGNRNVLVGNDIYNSDTQECVIVAGDDNLITGNMIYAGTEGSDKGVFLHGDSNRTRVEANQFVGSFTTAAVDDSGTDSVVRNNSGYVTENWGNASISPDSNGNGTIAHGLAASPSYASVHLGGDNVNGVDVEGVGGTNITVRVKDASGSDVTTGSFTVYWEARV